MTDHPFNPQLRSTAAGCVKAQTTALDEALNGG